VFELNLRDELPEKHYLSSVFFPFAFFVAFFHLAAAPAFALALLSSSVSAENPFGTLARPPRLPSATAAAFFFSI